MRKESGEVDLIEVFAPNDAALWTDAAPGVERPIDHSTAQAPRRLVVVGALFAVIAVIVGAVALSDDDGSEATPSSTGAATPSTARPLLDPSPSTHFLIDHEALMPYSADIVTPPGVGELVQVWTDGTAVGPLVVLELHPHAYEAYGVLNATRDVIDGVEVARSHTYCPSGISTSERCERLVSEVAIDDNWSVTARATHIKAADFATIVKDLRIVNGKLADESAAMEALELGLTFEDESLDDLVFGRVEYAVRYLTGDGQIATLRSAEGSADERLAGIRYLTTDAQMSFNGRTHGYLWTSDESVVVWEEGGRLLSLTASMDGADLSVISRDVEGATTAEWTSMLYGLRPDYTLGDFKTLATSNGNGNGNEPWRAGPQIAHRGGRAEYLWWWTVPGFDDVTASIATSRAVGMRPTVDTLVVPGATFVFVSRPNLAGTATVRTATGAEYSAEMTQPFSDITVYMTVVRIAEPGPITVTLEHNGVTVEL